MNQPDYCRLASQFRVEFGFVLLIVLCLIGMLVLSAIETLFGGSFG